jgi:hypothetical protein
MKTNKVVKKSYSSDIQPVYDIEVENDHHYIINDGIVSHNSGPIFMSDIVVSMNKYKLKEDEDGNKTKTVQGIRSKIKCVKSRYAKPFEEVEIHIPYDKGMDPYSGLFEMFEQKKILNREGNSYIYVSKEQNKEFKLTKKKMDNAFFDMIMREYDDSNDSVGINESLEDADVSE